MSTRVRESRAIRYQALPFFSVQHWKTGSGLGTRLRVWYTSHSGLVLTPHGTRGAISGCQPQPNRGLRNSYRTSFLRASELMHVQVMGMRNSPDSCPHSSTPINLVVRTLFTHCMLYHICWLCRTSPLCEVYQTLSLPVERVWHPD